MTDVELNELLSAISTPVLVDVWREGCAPCKVLSQQLSRVEQEVAEDDRSKTPLVVIRVKADEVPDFCVKHQVSSVPTLLLFREGAILERKVGAKGGYAALKEMLCPHLGQP